MTSRPSLPARLRAGRGARLARVDLGTLALTLPLAVFVALLPASVAGQIAEPTRSTGTASTDESPGPSEAPGAGADTFQAAPGSEETGEPDGEAPAADEAGPEGTPPDAPPDVPGAGSGTPADGEAAPAEEESGPAQLAEDVLGWVERLGLEVVVQRNSLRNWIILFACILAGLVAGKIASVILQRIGQRIAATRFRAQGRVFSDAAGPANLALIAGGISAGIAQLVMSPHLRGFLQDVIVLLLYLAFFWYLFNLAGLVEILLERISTKTHSALDDMLAPLVRKAVQVFVIIVGFLFIAENVFGQDIAAWLAGLGLLGLAVSLAAQDSLKNIFGSITIILDRPFQVGDRVQFGGYDGPVESIGFRSTRIRTLTGHLVTVPNSQLVSEAVENIGARASIRRILNVTITYDTPREKIEEAVTLLRNILEEPGIAEPIHGKIGEDEYPPRVYFNDFNADSLNIFVIYWYIPPNFWDYFAHAERLNLRIFEEFEKAGIEFAFPTQTIYLANDDRRQLALRMLGQQT